MATQDTTFVPNSTNFTAQMAQVLNDKAWKGRNVLYTTSTGTGSSYTITLPVGSLATGLVAGDSFTWKVHTTNSGPATLTVVGASSLGAKPILSAPSTPLTAGLLAAGAVITTTYDGTSFQTTLAGTGGGGGGGMDLFTQRGTGAIPRTYQSKVQEAVSVTDFGAKGDGTTDDSGAIQQALNSMSTRGGGLYFPPGNYKIGSTVSIPSANITLFGDRQSSRLFGSASILLDFPRTDTHVQNIHDLYFEQTGDGISVNMVQAWTYKGNDAPYIRNCTFYNSSDTTTTAVCINVSAIFAFVIEGCSFLAKGANSVDKGGYGIKGVCGTGLGKSIMNGQIMNNFAYHIARPLKLFTDVLGGGRVEGIKIVGNNFIEGYIAIDLSQTLAVTITGNQLSAFGGGIQSYEDFSCSIVGNGQITAAVAGIQITAGPMGTPAAERYTIVGNDFACNSGTGIRLINNYASGALRLVTITGNTFCGPASTYTVTGISLEGTGPITSVSITSNTFQWLLNGVYFSPVAHAKNMLDNNTFDSVTNHYNGFTYSGADGGSVTALKYEKATIQAGYDFGGTVFSITFDKPFTTEPAVFVQSLGTNDAVTDAPYVSAISPTGITIRKRQRDAGGSVSLVNYAVYWMAVGPIAT